MQTDGLSWKRNILVEQHEQVKLWISTPLRLDCGELIKKELKKSLLLAQYFIFNKHLFSQLCSNLQTCSDTYLIKKRAIDLTVLNNFYNKIIWNWQEQTQICHFYLYS